MTCPIAQVLQRCSNWPATPSAWVRTSAFLAFFTPGNRTSSIIPTYTESFPLEALCPMALGEIAVAPLAHRHRRSGFGMHRFYIQCSVPRSIAPRAYTPSEETSSTDSNPIGRSPHPPQMPPTQFRRPYRNSPAEKPTPNHASSARGSQDRALSLIRACHELSHKMQVTRRSSASMVNPYQYIWIAGITRFKVLSNEHGKQATTQQRKVCTAYKEL